MTKTKEHVVLPLVSEVVSQVENLQFGWIRDLPDHRDFTINTTELPKLPVAGTSRVCSVSEMLSTLGLPTLEVGNLPLAVDLRAFCSPIENQEQLGSCTAQAGVAMLEYFERRAFGQHIDGSRLFLYKTTRKLLGWTGDTGSYLRTTMGAMALFGIPQEKYYPHTIANFDLEPSAFVYALAQNYQAITYYRLDPPNTSAPELLKRIKQHVALKLPSMFGFSVYNSALMQAARSGKIPFPSQKDKNIGGHAVMIVGYDDNMLITNADDNSKTKGAFIIRNSWGTAWGERGYGYLPYEYVLKGLAVDFWCLLKSEYVDSNAFGI